MADKIKFNPFTGNFDYLIGAINDLSDVSFTYDDDGEILYSNGTSVTSLDKPASPAYLKHNGTILAWESAQPLKLAFKTITTDDGETVVADKMDDTLALTSDGKISVSGTAATDTIDFSLDLTQVYTFTNDVTVEGEFKGSRAMYIAGTSTTIGATGTFMFCENVLMSFTEGFTMPRDGSITDLTVNVKVINHSTTSDFVYAVLKNGNPTPVMVGTKSITGNGTFNDVTTQARNTDTFVAGDVLSLVAQRSGGGVYDAVDTIMTMGVQFDD